MFKMDFLHFIISLLLLSSTISQGCPTNEKSIDIIEGSGDTDYDDQRPSSITINHDGSETYDLGFVTGLRSKESGRMSDRASVTSKQDIYPPRAQKLDLDNESDEEGRNDDGTDEKRLGDTNQKLMVLVDGGSVPRITASKNDHRPHSQFEPDTRSRLGPIPSSQSLSVPSPLLASSSAGLIYPDLPGEQVLAKTMNPIHTQPDGPTRQEPMKPHNPRPSHLLDILVTNPSNPSTNIPDLQPSGLTITSDFVSQDPGDQELAIIIMNPVHAQPLGPSRPKPMKHYNLHPLLSPDVLAASPSNPAASIPDVQPLGVTTAPGFVAQDLGASRIMKKLPPELLMYFKTLRTSVESHLLEEFQGIGFSMGPHGEGQQMPHPRYRVICSSGDVEVRSYRRSTWISTTVNTSSFDVATYIGFHRLFRYIQGENTRGGKLAMAKPVRTQVLPAPTGRGMGELRGDGEVQSRYTVSFYSSRNRAVDLPTPLDRRISVEEMRPSRFYALTFDGFPISNRVDKQARGLARLLPNPNQNQSVPLGLPFFVDVYDTPMKLTDRHNEILIPLGINDSPRRWCSNPGPTAE